MHYSSRRLSLNKDSMREGRETEREEGTRQEDCGRDTSSQGRETQGKVKQIFYGKFYIALVIPTNPSQATTAISAPWTGRPRLGRRLSDRQIWASAHTWQRCLWL